MLTIQKNAIFYQFHGETVRVEPWGRDSFRVRAWMDGRQPEDHGALLEAEPCAAEGERTQAAAFLHNGDLTVRVTEEGLIGFYARGTLLLEEDACCNLAADPDYPTRTQRLPLRRPAREWRGQGRNWRLAMRFTAPEEERLFGMGQYQQDTWNLKGATLELMQRNSQCSVPFVLSSAGYGFLWNSPAVGRATFGTNVTVWEAEQTSLLDYWITVGSTPEIILRRYADATGHAPDFPDWALGFWQCKLRYRTQEEVLRVAERYHRLGIPLSAIIIDFFHWTNLGEWRFDPACFPDPADMAARLHAMGTRLGVSVWPHVAWNSEDHHDLYARGLLMRTDMGCDLTETWGGNSTYLDLTHPEARAHLQQKMQENYEPNGVDFYWLDEAEPELPFYNQALYRYHAGPAQEVGSLYAKYYAQTFAELDQVQGKPVMNLIRCAWAGSQRYGALVWSGDIPSTFRAMRIQLTAALHLGMAGIPWWTMDIGGFRGGYVDDEGFRELLMRWFAFGAFCPVMRLHGHREPMTPEEISKAHLQTGADNEIWSFGEEAFRVCRRFIHIRTCLRPCLQKAFEQARQGLPVMRPLFLVFPQDANGWSVSDEYVLGSDLLVAPVFEAGATSRRVYLPGEDLWINPWTGERFSGGQTVTVAAPVDQIPLFLRDEQLRQTLHTDTWQEEIP